MTAFEFLKYVREYIFLPMSVETPCTEASNAEIKRCSFRSNVDAALFLDFNGTANSGVIAECYFSSLDIAGAVAGGFDATGMHIFECYVAGEADTFGIVGGGTVYNDA